MRHQHKLSENSYTKVDVAAVWPATAQIAPLPVPDIEEVRIQKALSPTEAAPDVPSVVGAMIAGAYVMLLTTFALAAVASSYSVYMIAVCAMFLVAFFTVPWLFLRQEPSKAKRPSLDRFMEQGMETLTGRCSGSAALVQILIVPVFLTLGVIAMGITAAIII